MVQRTTKLEVITRFRDLVKTADARFANRTYVVCGDGLPSNLDDHLFLTVRMTGGSYDYATHAANGAYVVPYKATLAVTLWKADRRDRGGTIDSLGLDSAEGLYKLEHNLLKTVVGSDLAETPGAEGLLTTAITAISDDEITRLQHDAFGDVSVSSVTAKGILTVMFAADFHWDLGISYS